MAQRDKVKELVGRGLNSYHTKSLQQMDRIEKKNKEQNHKISILSNELDNDYLTKTEEGSVISLEHSKEGMVYLDEIQGNTMVNYCTDGSKEMTLNGDIDVEGTFVTTTEGVDNGKVDVMCEGNTLINKLYKIKNYGSPAEFKNYGWSTAPNNCTNFEWIDNGIKLYAFSDDTKLDRYYRSSPDKYGIFKKNRTYIVRMNVNSNNLQQNATILRCFYGNGTTFITGQMSEVVNGVFIKKATTSSTIEEVDAIHSMISLDYRTPREGIEGWVSFQNVMVIDVTDLPSYQQDVEYWRNIEYFEGMKSVGQDDENGHKIEILSSVGKPNLIKNSGFLNSTSNYSFHNGSKGEVIDDASSQSGKILKITTGTNGGVSGPFQANIVKHIEDKKYTLSGWCKGEVGTTLGVYIERHKSVSITFTNDDWVRFVVTSEQNPTNWNRTITFYSSNTSKIFYLKDIKMEESENDTPYVPHTTEKNYNSFNKINKKEILLNEPLRGLPNGVKDKFVKIGGKWFIERNCGEIMFDGSDDEDWGRQENLDTNNTERYYIQNNSVLAGFKPTISDTLPTYVAGERDNLTHLYVHNEVTRFDIKKLKSDTRWSDVTSLKQWLQNNPTKVVYQLKTPIYEPLEIEPTLNTYNDITHISNNSIIPCNIKIKNSGYNAIIKPSTLYTVALDTNKSGTIGMTLGGVKGTTTNNVLKLTTPATLTDDSLRLYGKGIKGSKVRLLEGDKTNWIPSHFEGMKSSFEDKFDSSDNTYKMEISSKNKNLFTHKEYIPVNGLSVETPNDNTVILKDATPNNYKQLYLWIRGLKANVNYIVTSDVNAISGIPLIALQDAKTTNDAFISKTESRNRATFKLKQGHDTVKLRLFVNHQGGDIAGHIEYKNIQIREETTSETYEETKSNKIQFSSIEPLRGVGDIKDKFVFKDDGKLYIERNTIQADLTRELPWSLNKIVADSASQFVCRPFSKWGKCEPKETEIICSKKPTLKNDGGKHSIWVYDKSTIVLQMDYGLIKNINDLSDWLDKEKPIVIVPLVEPTYEEIPFELQKIILEGYENGTLFFDTNIPPTSTVRYAGETPIVRSVKLNKTEVLNNTNDINDNIIPYLMDMDYRVVCLQLATEEIEGGVSMARLFGGAYEMLKRDILSKRLTREEYGHRLADYFNAGKLTEEQVRELEELR